MKIWWQAFAQGTNGANRCDIQACGHSCQIGKKPSNPNNDGYGGIWLADYIGNAWAGNKELVASWMDTRNGSYAQDYVGGLKR